MEAIDAIAMQLGRSRFCDLDINACIRQGYYGDTEEHVQLNTRVPAIYLTVLSKLQAAHKHSSKSDVFGLCMKRGILEIYDTWGKLIRELITAKVALRDRALDAEDTEIMMDMLGTQINIELPLTYPLCRYIPSNIYEMSNNLSEDLGIPKNQIVNLELGYAFNTLRIPKVSKFCNEKIRIFEKSLRRQYQKIEGFNRILDSEQNPLY